MNGMRILLVLAVMIPACFAQVEVATKTPDSPAFTEGPTVDADGNVYFTNLGSQSILKLAPDGTLTTFREESHGANGLVFDAQYRLLACESGREHHRITRTDMKTGEIEVLADSYQGQPLNGPNDITVDGKGRIYFSDPSMRGNEAVYRIDTDGTLRQLIATPDIDRPNGLQISPDDKHLYLVESNGAEGRSRRIRVFDLAEDGTLSNPRVLINFYPGRSADGLAIDSEGNLYAAAGLHNTRGTSETLDTKPGVHIISPEGEEIEYIPTPQDTITNLAFGGPDLKTLYVTAGDTLFRVRTKVAGMRR
jgi:gluconolactonase